MTPPAGSGVSRVTPAASSAARLTSSAWWSCAHSAQRRPGATVSRSSAVGQRPQRSTSQPWPSSHAAGIGQRRVGGPDPLQALGERRGVGQVDLAGRGRGAREVEMRVGEARDRDLVGLEGDPLGERVGPRLEVDLRPGERHPPVADPDRLDPAEPVVAGERRDPAGDQGVERHGVRVVGRRGAPPARRGRGRRPSPSASATLALTAQRWPTGSAPARIHVAPPPGNA